MIDETAIYVIGFSLTIIGMLGGALYWLGGKFGEIDARFREINMRFREMDARFERIDERFREVDRKINRLGEAFVGYQEFFIEFLTSEGVIKAERADVLKGEVRRVMRLATSANPLTKEEWERLGQLLDKDIRDLTYEEALELRELARKVVREYGEYPEAWKLHIYASIAVGLAAKRRAEGARQGGGQPQ